MRSICAFSYIDNGNLADMPRPTDPAKRVCYADDLTVWASGANIRDLEVTLNHYLEELTVSMKDTSLLISAPKSSVMLLTPDTQRTIKGIDGKSPSHEDPTTHPR